VFGCRVRFAFGAILGGVLGVLYAPSLQEEFALLGIARDSPWAALVSALLTSLACGYLCVKLRL